ncbi:MULTISPECIES: MgtC/SapB family protein [Psychrobacillus]|jgi:putative Mg2+ transporter-C (MgtC) family protein|uniref:MgtC/SapB family protein n=1 Tax=Psychrobacillus faecigallinarum TaxID=2762235 RepID=A0ABR8RDA6_9BACI|nr:MULTISPECIES: MgtC/SapB family protein [Psychrobacillus]MBD7945783.1 MgtC/SapB family protein [Psychrobacillus faecigallinarum]QEY22492.1 MgtC/SapB family protein [Psychrobacillus sp. AK 1817]QGM29359.1 MgtC/SapB family protein [Bacillus sp. N3536]
MDFITSLFNSHVDLYIRLAVATFIGLLIGLERAIKHKPAGIRTHILVCLGSTLAMSLSTLNQGPYMDPMRLAAQVISGIGFLGAGVIWVDKDNVKRGLTTAANLWITACVGLTIGYGAYDLAIITVVFMFVAMNLPKLLEKMGMLPPRGKEVDDKDSDSDGE